MKQMGDVQPIQIIDYNTMLRPIQELTPEDKEKLRAIMDGFLEQLKTQTTNVIMGHEHKTPQCEVCDGTKTYHRSTMNQGVLSKCWACC